MTTPRRFPPTAPVSGDDHAAIIDLCNRFNLAIDAWDLEAMFALFAEDGAVLHPRGAFRGREGLREFYDLYRPFVVGTRRQGLNHVLTPRPDGTVDVVFYMLIVRVAEPAGADAARAESLTLTSDDLPALMLHSIVSVGMPRDGASPPFRSTARSRPGGCDANPERHRSRERRTREIPMHPLVEEAIAAHGGMDQWNALRRIEANVSLTGPFYDIKGQAQGMRRVQMHVDPHAQRVDVSPFPHLGTIGRYEHDRVAIIDGHGKVVADLPEARGTFDGRLDAQWSDLQLLYFNAYAMWNYLTLPFLLARPGFELAQLPDHREANETWRPLRVVFPDDIVTHSREQTLYFDEKGLLKRLDYVTDVAGGVAAHYCYDHLTFGGLVFPTLRRVTRRTDEGAWPSLRTFILIEIGDVYPVAGDRA